MNKKKILRTVLPGIRTKLSFFTAILVISILAVTTAIHYNQQKNALEDKLDAELKTPLEYINSAVLDLENLNRSLVMIEEFKVRVREKKKELSRFKRTVVSKETGFLGSLKALGQSMGLNVKRGNVYHSVDTYFTRYLSEKEIEDFESKVRNELRKETGAPIDPVTYEKIRGLAEKTAAGRISAERSRSRIEEIDEELQTIEPELIRNDLDPKKRKLFVSEKEKLAKEQRLNEKTIPEGEKKALYFETLLTKALQNFFRGSYKDRISSLGLMPDKIRIFAYDRVGKETLDTGLLFPQSSGTGKKLLTQESFLKSKKSLFDDKDAIGLVQEKSRPENYEVGGRQYEVVFRPVFRNPNTAERARRIYEIFISDENGFKSYLEEDKKTSADIREIAVKLKSRITDLKKEGKVKPGSDSEFRNLAEGYRKLIKKRESKFEELQPNNPTFEKAEKKWKEEYLSLQEKGKITAKEILDWEQQLKTPQKEGEKKFSTEEIQDKIRNLEAFAEEVKDSIVRMEAGKNDWTGFKERILNDSFLEIRNAALEDFAFVPFKTGPSGLVRYYKDSEERKTNSAKAKLFREWILSGNSETDLPKPRGKISFADSGILVRSRTEAEEMMWELDSTPLLVESKDGSGLVYDLLRKDLLGFNIILLDRTEGYRQIRNNREESVRYASIIGVVAILLAYLLAWLFVRKIKTISRKTEEIEKGNLDVEFPSAGYDEIGILSESLNDMVHGLKEREEMRGELAAAEEIQKRLLPEKLPTGLEDKIELAAFYKAMAGVGGDYYDFIELADGKLVFCIGDVSNHGVGPAIVMALFRAQIRSIFRRGERNLKKILLEVNASLYEDTPDHIFVTFFLGVFDPSNSQVEYVSAGHIKPMLYDASKNKIHELPAGGLPLGMDENSFFETTIERRSLVMDAGDIFFEYTDGFDEARSLDGSFFGRERVAKLLLTHGGKAVPEVIAQMVTEAELHTSQNLSKPGMSSLSDDIAMIAIKKK
ncbi:PP2C family protein-serine/threonine phosphatase [Leptospira ilyithenensis]|uniref:HAMP domain-containing protein n=1 Tax=Leptospira ilyithenensis TaxID=2484901 RepID=A0A4R9LPM6_9LEPT|nr:SpoIIE family protein phosphatase [Leptospira ilyithenensis]TGN09143.1 HAMP domain-containing protein [Leptospira ilyithenensis]